MPAMTAKLRILPAHMRSDTFPDFTRLVQRQTKEQTAVVKFPQFVFCHNERTEPKLPAL